MNLNELKLDSLGIDKKKFDRIYAFVDFGNVNYWYEKDEYDADNKLLSKNEKLAVDIKKLSNFIDLFSNHKRFYFGLDNKKKKSWHIIKKARDYFDKAITKPIQKIKHYLDEQETKTNTRTINKDLRGNYIYIPKCNFDVEISVDAIRFINKYDTFCLFSSDADFVFLLEYLKRNQKKIILIKGGFAQHNLVKSADLVLNAQKIKKDITFIKQKSRL